MLDPILVLAGSLCAGIFIADQLMFSHWIWAAVFVLFLLPLSFFLARRSRGSWTCLCLLFVAGGGFLFQAAHIKMEVFDKASSLGPRGLSGRVIEAGRPDSRTSYVLDHVRLATPSRNFAWRGKVSLTLAKSVSLLPGDQIELAGGAMPLEYPQAPRNPGQWDWEKLARSRGITARVFPGPGTQIKILSRDRFGFWERRLREIRRRWSESLQTPADATAAGKSQATLLLKGMVLGERAEIDPKIQESFIRTNTFHILAISGQQMALIFLILFGVLRALGVTQKNAAFVSIPAMLVYGAVVGWYASVARSVIMVVFVLVALMFDRKINILRLLGIAALALLLANPDQLFDIGFQLSFLAVLFLVVFTGPLVRWAARWAPSRPAFITRLLMPALGASLIAWFATAPLTALRFHWFSPITLIANLLIVTWVSVLTIPLGFASVILGSIWIGLAYPINAINQILSKFLIVMAGKIAAVPYASFDVASPGAWSLIFYYACFAAIAWRLEKCARQDRARVARRDAADAEVLASANSPAAAKRRAMKVWILAGALACCALGSEIVYRHRLECVFFDVGQGDAIFVRFPNGKNMLVDAGPGGYRNRFDKTLASYMRCIGASKIDHLVMSHPHSDHIGGMPKILENIRVAELDGNGRAFASLVYRHVLRMALERKVPLRILHGPAPWFKEAGVSVDALFPPDPDLHPRDKNENEHSIVLVLRYPGGSLLLPGDIERDAENYLTQSAADLRCDILKVPHHGGARSSGARFLDRVKARWAIISAGKDNKFGHPTQSVLQRLMARGTGIFRTDQDGAVVIRGYGWFWTLRTYASKRFAIIPE